MIPASAGPGGRPSPAASAVTNPETPVYTTAIATAKSSDIPAHGTATFPRLIGDLVARFVNIAPDTVDDTIVDTQRQIVLALGMDRSLFLQISPNGDLAFTHQWTRPEFSHYDTPDRLSAYSARAHFPWLLSQLRGGAIVVVDDVDELPSELDRESLRRVGTRSNVTVPIFHGRPVARRTLGGLAR